jgi:hypothetical protein
MGERLYYLPINASANGGDEKKSRRGDGFVEMRGIEPRSEEKTTKTFTSIVRSSELIH